MTPQQMQNRALRREQVERCLAADMSIKEWCELNRVSESTMYRWRSVFRREEPELFSDPTQGEWIELSRGSIAARTALAVRPADDAPEAGAPAGGDAPTGGNVARPGGCSDSRTRGRGGPLSTSSAASAMCARRRSSCSTRCSPAWGCSGGVWVPN